MANTLPRHTTLNPKSPCASAGPPARAVQPGNCLNPALPIRLQCPAAGGVLVPKIIAIYPGSFDPVTNGHLDLIERASKLFDRLVVAILLNPDKDPLFSVPERVEMLKEVVKHLPNVEVDTFGGLLVDYARRKGARVLLRGIRAVSDYEYELQMALMNRQLQPDLETVFMLPGEAYSYLSSRLVREVARLGGSIKDLVPAAVEQRIRTKVAAS